MIVNIVEVKEGIIYQVEILHAVTHKHIKSIVLNDIPNKGDVLVMSDEVMYNVDSVIYYLHHKRAVVYVIEFEEPRI